MSQRLAMRAGMRLFSTFAQTRRRACPVNPAARVKCGKGKPGLCAITGREAF